VANQILGEMWLGGHEWRIYAFNAAANAAAGCGGFLLFGGWRLLRQRPADQDQDIGPPMNTHAAAPQSLPFLPRHWITLAVIAALIVAVVFGKTHIGMAAFAGAALLSVLRLADERETSQKVPWSVIVMVCGVSTLAALLDQTGGTRRFAELISMISTPATLSGVIAFVAGIVSIYSSTTGVVLPAFLPMVKDLAAVHPENDPLGLAVSVLIGGNLVDMSPLSTIGALCLAAAPAGVDRRMLFNQLLAWGFAMSVVGAVVCWAGWGGA
jgi:di/tricarboxylate transporter